MGAAADHHRPELWQRGLNGTAIPIQKTRQAPAFHALDSKVVFAEPRIMFCVPDISVP
jgi:hypothetical protein